MKTRIAMAAAVLLALPATARAQIAWDTPRLIGPDSPAGLGLYWLRSSTVGPETDGAMATWALPGTGGSVIVRGGAGIDADDDISVFGGIDMRSPITRHTEEQPLDIEWYGGVGVGGGAESDQYFVLSVPMGISAGRSWTSGSIWLAPYVALGLALDLAIGDDIPDEEFTATPAADIGLDFALDPARNFIIRVATSLGDRQALAVGLTLGG